MAFNQAEYRQHLTDASKRDTADTITRNLRLHERAGLEANAVTGDPHWDHYLAYIQAAIIQTEEQIDGLKAKLCGDTVDYEGLLTLKLLLAKCEGRVEAWISARDLPKELIDNGDKAHALLADSVTADTSPA